MASTAHQTEEALREHEEDAARVEAAAAALAALIAGVGEEEEKVGRPKRVVFFTGAGMSTSAGVPDFRGPQGVWTLRAKGQLRTAKTTSTLRARPTPGHMALVALQQQGLLDYVISQNTDGLHVRSGIHPDAISELHGNSNLEVCPRCDKHYLRDGRTRTSLGVHEHGTGRHCIAPGCDGMELHDTIVNFGESLPEEPLRRAYAHARGADVMVVLGSSLTVSPANDLPRACVANGGKLVIVNKQKTPLDDLAHLRVFAGIDEVMTAALAHLGLAPAPWRLERFVVLRRTADGALHMHGEDVCGTSFTVCPSFDVRVVPQAAAPPSLSSSKNPEQPQ